MPGDKYVLSITIFIYLCNQFLVYPVWANKSNELEDTFDKPSKRNRNSHNKKKIGYSREMLKDNNTIMDSLEWTNWSKCIRCFQSRSLQICHKPKCKYDNLQHEKQCYSKRCKRKIKAKRSFQTVLFNKENHEIVMKEGNLRSWTRWTNWTPCSITCRTERFRFCRKQGRCYKQQEHQNAYCYHEQSNCELFVVNLMNKQRTENDNRYQYQYEGVQTEPLQNRYQHHPYKRKYSERQQRRRRFSKRCGRPNRRSAMLKIIGGAESEKYKWPWHVALLNQYSDVFCGGTLIAPQWVLTACHCVRPFLKVRLNEHDLLRTDGRELELTVHRIFQHPLYNPHTVDGDIALLQLPTTVKTPIACLPNKEPSPQELCHVMGWGKIKTDSLYGTSRLRETKIPIVNTETCEWSYRNFMITSNMVCAGWRSGRSDTCAGDSGGGLMCPKQSIRGNLAYSVQGITSFGKGCGKRNKYGIYTKVYNYINWIKYIIRYYHI